MQRETLRQVVLALAVLVGLVLAFAMVCIGYLVVTSDTGIDPSVSRAHLNCALLDQAIERYVQHEGNAQKELPQTLGDLLQPPWGGPSLLKGGPELLIDPWGKPFQMERRLKPNGAEYVLVWTTAPNGLPISQFGFGPNAEPEWPDENPM